MAELDFFDSRYLSLPLKTSRKPWWRRWFGSRSERAAVRYLKRQGFHILRRNYFCPHGEIDIIAATPDRCVVFVEVRSTEAESTSRPVESVDATKQKRLTDLALYFLQRHQLLENPARFDVIAISWPVGQREPLIEHYPQAFEATGRFQMFS